MKINFFFRNKNCYTSRRFIEEALSLSIDFSVYDPMMVSLINDRLFYEGTELENCDLAFFRGSVEALPREHIISIASFYELEGTKTVNSSSSIAICANKWITRNKLKKAGIPVPKGCLIFSSNEFEKAIDYLGGFPIVFKFFYGCSGMGVVYVPDRFTLESLYDAYKVSGFSFFFEDYLPAAMNGVRRFIVSGGELIADFVMAPSENDFRSNFAKGGQGGFCLKKDCFSEIAIKSVAACNLTTGSVDMVVDNESAVVLEVNSSPGIEMAEATLKSNLASAILKCLK